MQFLGHTCSPMTSMVWKPWATPKCKIFSWLVIQNWVWTADRLHRRGCPNCGRCKLCNQVQESSTQLILYCRYMRRMWTNLKTWLGLVDIQPQEWTNLHSVQAWWREVIQKRGKH
jgi:hypothetical protein